MSRSILQILFYIFMRNSHFTIYMIRKYLKKNTQNFSNRKNNSQNNFLDNFHLICYTKADQMEY